MAQFHYVTVWRIAAPRHEVWSSVFHSERWPTWWKSVQRVVDLERGSLDGTGSVRRYTWKGKLPYRITFDLRVTQVQAMTVLEGVASGDVEGTGRWEFSEHDSVTTAVYDWNVRTTGTLMNLLALLGRPLIRWNHNQIMSEGAQALADLLHARLVDITHR